MKKQLVTGLAVAVALQVWGQVSTETITRELQFEKRGSNNTIMIFNINGNIKVEGYSGDKVVIEVEKRISAKTGDRLALHQIYAPGFYTGYGVKTLPGVREAMEEKKWDEANAQAKAISATLNTMSEHIDNAARQLRGQR